MPNVPKITEWKQGVLRYFPNGITAWACSHPKAKQYACVITLSVGSAEDPEDRPGCAHCFEHIPFRGAGRFQSNLAMLDPLEEFNGDLDAATSLNDTYYSFTADPRVRDHALDVLTAMVTTPHYSGVEVERETILREYYMRRSDQWTRAFERTRELFFPDPCWARAPIGTPESIQSMTAAHLRAFHEQWYKPENMIVTIVGPASANEMLDLLEQRLGSLVGKSSEPRQRPRSCMPKTRQGASAENWEFTDTCAACIGVFPYTNRLSEVAEVYKRMLNAGMSAPLFEKLREQAGYFYTADVSVSVVRGFASFLFMSMIQPDRVNQFWIDFWSVVRSNTLLDKRRLEWVQNRSISAFRHQLFNPETTAKNAADELMNCGRVFLRNEMLADRLRVTLQNVHDFHEQFFHPSVCLQVTMNP